MTQAPILIHPNFTQSFIPDVDASNNSIGAVLSQKTEKGEQVVAFASRTLSKAERRYCVTKKELLALVNFAKYFRHFLYGKKFVARTDHGSLKWLMNFKNPEGHIARWIEFLSSFDMIIEHRPGKAHGNADGVSRIPCRQCGNCDKEEESNQCYNINQVTIDCTEDSVICDLATAQDENNDICLVKSWVKSGERPTTKAVSSESWFVKSLMNQWNRLEILDNILVRRWDVLGTNFIHWQAIVPLSHRRTVLKYMHDIKASGHLGIKKTLSRLRTRYYWPGCQNDVKVYIGGCEKCAKRKGPIPTKYAPMQVVRSGFPMERLAIDILGELPTTERGNKYILVIADYFTKWTECFPMPNMESKTCAKILVEEVVSRFGVPNCIHSDQGRQFESRLFKDMCQLLQIDKTRTTPYHPQSDGMVERFNRTLCAMLSSFVNDNHTNWDTMLPYVLMAYRSSDHETTGMSPNMLMLGRETTIPLDILYEMPVSLKSYDINQWVWELRETLETAHTFVRQNTGTSIQRQKRYHDEKANYEQFKVDDTVYVYFPVKKTGQTSKFSSFWRGPFKIVRKCSEALYKVDCGRNGLVQLVHIDRIKKAKKQKFTDESDILASPGVEPEILIPDEAGIEVEGSDDIEKEVVTHSRFGRAHKKPVWMNDYVCSIFREKRAMPQTKTTPRKREVEKAICPLCKDDVRGQNWKEHLLKCADSRHMCDHCDKSFKKAEYLKQHVKRKHGSESTDLLDDNNTACGSSNLSLISSPENTDDESNSDWKDDPEVELAEELRGDAFQQGDHRSVTDIRSGRMFRKRTCPTPVVAPIKFTKASATITSASSEYKEDIGSGEKLHINKVETASSSKMTDELPPKEEPQRKLMTVQNTTIEFAVNGGEDSGKQELRIQQNGEDVMFMSQRRTKTRSIDLNMSDFIEVDSIRPENISFKVTSGKLVMDIKTE